VRVQEALQWLRDGFNATLLAYGQAGTGHADLLLGHTQPTRMPQRDEGGGDTHNCLLTQLLSSILAGGTPNSSQPSDTTVHLCCWQLSGNKVTDLFEVPGRSSCTVSSTVFQPALD
jgi:hypothetical protein